MSISAVFVFVNCPFFALNRRQFIPQDFSTMDSGNKIIFRRALNHCESEREQEKKRVKKVVVNHSYKLFIIGFKSDCVPLSTTRQNTQLM